MVIIPPEGVEDYKRLINEAREFARKAHQGQKRKYYDADYFVHPERIATVAQEMGLPPDIVMAAYLHDVKEDTPISYDEIQAKFGNLVTEHVRWMTNPSKAFPRLPRDERKKMDREHLSQAPDQIKILKALDRIDNLKDMSLADPSFRKKYAKESLLLADALLERSPSETLAGLVSKLRELSNQLFRQP